MSCILDLSDISFTALHKSVWVYPYIKWAETQGGGVLIILCPFYVQDPVTGYYKICKAAQLLLSGLQCKVYTIV